MEITLCIIGLMIAALTLWYQFFKMLADNAEYKRQQAEKNRKPLLIVEKKGKGWELIEEVKQNESA